MKKWGYVALVGFALIDLLIPQTFSELPLCAWWWGGNPGGYRAEQM